MKEKIKENADKIKVFKVLPYLVSNVVEVSPGLDTLYLLYMAVLVVFVC